MLQASVDAGSVQQQAAEPSGQHRDPASAAAPSGSGVSAEQQQPDAGSAADVDALAAALASQAVLQPIDQPAALQQQPSAGQQEQPDDMDFQPVQRRRGRAAPRSHPAEQAAVTAQARPPPSPQAQPRPSVPSPSSPAAQQSVPAALSPASSPPPALRPAPSPPRMPAWSQRPVDEPAGSPAQQERAASSRRPQPAAFHQTAAAADEPAAELRHQPAQPATTLNSSQFEVRALLFLHGQPSSG